MQKVAIVKFVLATLFFFLLLYGGFAICKRQLNQLQHYERILNMPTFISYLPNGEQHIFSNERFCKRYILIAYMSIECEHCDYMTKILVSSKEKFNNASIYLIVQNNEATVNYFIKHYNLDKWTELTVLNDKKYSAFAALHVTAFPSFYIYNGNNGKLIKQIKGETKIENILSVLK